VPEQGFACRPGKAFLVVAAAFLKHGLALSGQLAAHCARANVLRVVKTVCRDKCGQRQWRRRRESVLPISIWRGVGGGQLEAMNPNAWQGCAPSLRAGRHRCAAAYLHTGHWPLTAARRRHTHTQTPRPTHWPAVSWTKTDQDAS